MKKDSKLKLAGALLGATLITATAGAADMKKSGEQMMNKDNNMTSAEMMKKKKMQEHAKAADKKQAVSKWG